MAGIVSALLRIASALEQIARELREINERSE